jgi:hypothetical protein
MTQHNPTRCAYVITKRGAFKGRTVKALCTNHFVERVDGQKYCAVHARKVRGEQSPATQS